MKKYGLSVVVGRFHPFHLGHKAIVDKALEESEAVLVLIGSAQEEGTERNPFSYNLRSSILKGVYTFEDKTNVYVAPIEDLTHENDISFEWGKFLLDRINDYIEILNLPELDAMFYGDDEEREGWFDPDDIVGISMNPIARGSEVEISGTELREMIYVDNYRSWMNFVHTTTFAYYYAMQESLKGNPYYAGRQENVSESNS